MFASMLRASSLSCSIWSLSSVISADVLTPPSLSSDHTSVRRARLATTSTWRDAVASRPAPWRRSGWLIWREIWVTLSRNGAIISP